MRLNPVLALAASFAAAQSPAPNTPAANPQFEVASITQCKPDPPSGATKGGRGGGGAGEPSPGLLRYPCLPAWIFIEEAYISFPDGKKRAISEARLEGGPEWIHTDRYTINAKADRPVSQAMMRGPMLQALLEDRFKLKIRRETRETPLYALTVAKGGPKLKKWDEGSCTLRDATAFPPPPLEPGKPPFCRSGVLVNAHKMSMNVHGETMAEFARRLTASGRPVIDRTGISGRYDISFEFAPAEGAIQYPPGVDPPDFSGAPSVFSALAEIGLKLEPIKGPREFLVIDHIERPTEN